MQSLGRGVEGAQVVDGDEQMEVPEVEAHEVSLTRQLAKNNAFDSCDGKAA